LADEEGKNLFLIGDPNQAIYGFRGADDKLLFQIKENFPSCQIFSLKDDYRSHASIIDSAQQLISHNPQIIPSNLNSIRGKGPAIKNATSNETKKAPVITINCADLGAALNSSIKLYPVFISLIF